MGGTAIPGTTETTDSSDSAMILETVRKEMMPESSLRTELEASSQKENVRPKELARILAGRLDREYELDWNASVVCPIH
jgi:hypothetical protein